MNTRQEMNMEKTVALFGGSFNPPHEGHFGMASYIHNTLAVDETWMLFSQSVDKDPSVYAPLEHRMKMAAIMAKHYREPIVLSDLEAKIAEEKGRNDTFYILEGLKERFQNYKFIFVMGADTFAGFHNWKERDDILKSTIIAVVDRPGYTEKALNSPTAKEFAEQVIDLTQPENLENAASGWCFLNNPQIDASSSHILEKLAAGDRDFEGPFAEVADYIYEHGLYGTGEQIKRPVPALQLCY
jgi:nicotinate-nucleotide adenylyltransferase